MIKGIFFTPQINLILTMSKKVITVFGATGAQGGGLVRAILADANSEFSVRAVTRDTASDKAQALAAIGAELVAADVDDKESIRKTLEGSYGAYFVTFFWDHFSPDKEFQQARNFAEAAKEAGIQHAIWSTLEDTREFMSLDDDRMPTLQGQYKVPHFDKKGEADALFTEAGVPTTFLRTSFYWDNFIYFGSGPQKGPDGKQYLTFPLDEEPMSGIAAEDIGKCAYGVFKKGSELIGKTVGIAGEHLTGQQMAEKMSKALGIEIHYNNVTPDVYRSFGFPGADDLGNMFQFYRDFSDEFMGIRKIEDVKALNPELQDFDTWLAANAAKIPVTA
jgi:uncharacterized protein YbjT (DUF2867 family)